MSVFQGGGCARAGRVGVLVLLIAAACAPAGRVGPEAEPVGAVTTSAAAPPAAPVGPPLAAPGELPALPAESRWICAGSCLRWRAVLASLDRHRLRAYAKGRPQLLRRVYVPGSQIIRRDRRMLTAWIRRDATVSGVRLRVLYVRRLASAGAAVRLRVVDRMAPATAVLPGGRRVALPRDLPTARMLVLTRAGGRWRIAASR